MFHFKQFSVKQERSAMKVGTDGVLLGAWADTSVCEGKNARILDIGAGTGLIALMMAQRCQNCQIEAVEVDEESAAEANENFGASPWAERLKIHTTDIQSYTSDKKYDLILSNPPYFVNSLHPPTKGRSIARHTDGLSFAELATAVASLLSPSGRFALILPVLEMQEFDAAARGLLSLGRECEVRSVERGEVKRIMREYTHHNQVITPTKEELTIAHKSTQERLYTEEYRSLTRDFYLKF